MQKKPGTLYPVSTFTMLPSSSSLPVLPISDDGSRSLQLEITRLKDDIARQHDKIRRMREMIEDEIVTWTRLIETGEGEKYQTVRRRISRLKGALQYPGIKSSYTER